MRKMFCDRCGQEFEYGDKVELVENNGYEVCIDGPVHYGYGRDHVDICPECQRKLNTLVTNFMKSPGDADT